MNVTTQHISETVTVLGLSGKPVCLHSSLRSFGWVEGGAAAIVHGFLEQGCTVLVPTFSSQFSEAPTQDRRIARNGCGDYSWTANRNDRNMGIYSPDGNEIDEDMGAIPRAVLQMNHRVRGNHPLDSFAAAGPLAQKLIADQQPNDVYAPLKALLESGGFVILMGVGLNRLTLLHYAEQLAGRQLFRRWAKDAGGHTIAAEVGGCSEGFHQFEAVVSSIRTEITVGHSRWSVFDAAKLVELTSDEIRSNPLITHCGDAGCDRCNDAVLGGPLLT